MALPVEEERVPNLLLTSLARRDPAVELLEELVQLQSTDYRTRQQAWIGNKLDEGEAPAQGSVEKLDAAVRSVHGADHVHIRRNHEGFVTLGQSDDETTLVLLEKGNQLAEHLGDV